MKKLSREWGDALTWLVYSVIGITIPVLLSMLLSVAMGLGFSVDTITDGGQFALYSVAMLVTTHYLLTKPAGKFLPGTGVIGIVFLVAFCFAVAMFSIAIMAQNGQEIQMRIIEWPSIALCVFCLAIAFYAFLSDKKREMSGSKYRSMTASSQTDLTKKFDSMREQRGEQP